MTLFQNVFVGLLLLCFLHIVLTYLLFKRLKTLYPDVWKKLGNPTRFDLMTGNSGTFHWKFVYMNLFKWPQTITDSYTNTLRLITLVTMALGVVGFVYLLVLIKILNIPLSSG